MDDFNKLATMDEITAHYKSLDVPIPICWLLNGKLNFLTGGNPGMDINFSSGTIYSELDELTGNYDLLRFENGYMMYNISFEVNNIVMTDSQSPDLIYDVELPVHFTKTPFISVNYARLSFAPCYVTFDINPDHMVDYLPSMRLNATTEFLNRTSGYINIHMEGF